MVRVISAGMPVRLGAVRSATVTWKEPLSLSPSLSVTLQLTFVVPSANVEPYAGDRVEDNLNPVGRAYYAASTMICTPCSLAQEVGTALGAQAGEARMREIVMRAGFTRFRRAIPAIPAPAS